MTTHQHGVRREYAALAPGYESRWKHYLDVTRARALAAAAAQPGERVLDAACGSGLLLRDLADRASTPALTGLDASPAMLERARGRLPSAVRLVEGRLERLPFPRAAFDLVTCVNALHHCADPALVFAEFRRVLAPRGRLVIVDWRRDLVLMRLMKSWLALRRRPIGHVSSMGELAARAEAAGFAVDGIEPFRVRPAWAMMTLRAHSVD